MNEIFSLSEKEKSVLTKWKNEQDEDLYLRIKSAADSNPVPQPSGPIGGVYTYSFTPTSIGVMIKVRNALTEKEIDLTNYDEW